LTYQARGNLPPYPVSASAMRGTRRSRLAIMPAWSLISFKVATPRSGIPSLDIVVPAPVFCFRDVCEEQYCIFYILATYHIQALKPSIQSDSSCQAIKNSRANNNVVFLPEHRSQLLNWRCHDRIFEREMLYYDECR